ncbi:hypothetical protein V6N13_018730 [Hibiscus sabdariffa]
MLNFGPDRATDETYLMYFILLSEMHRILDSIRENMASACFGTTPEGNMIAAAGDALWNNGTVCGKMFTVTCTGPRNPVTHPCTGKSVMVKIVDHCP